MLHHLIRSAARTTSRSPFAPFNKSANVSIRRAISGQKDPRLTNKFTTIWLGGAVAVMAGIVYTYSSSEWRDAACIRSAKKCVSKYDPLPPIYKHDSDQSIKKADPFESGKISFVLYPGVDRSGRIESVRLCSDVKFDLSVALNADNFKQICDGLERRGIHGERSEEGARRGLTEYALKYMQKGVNEHLEKKCDCFDKYYNHRCIKDKTAESCFIKYDLKSESDSAAGQIIKKSDPFESGDVKFVLLPLTIDESSVRLGTRTSVNFEHSEEDYNQICNGLANRDIQVEHSDSGARIGLNELALKYMQKGVNEHLQKKCRCSEYKCHCIKNASN